jgi:ATP-binding cassette subfamily B protein
VWFIGGHWVLQAGNLQRTQGIKPDFALGDLMAFLGYLWMFYQPLGQLTQLTNWLTGFLTATHRTFEILDTPIQIAEAEHPTGVPEMRGHILFDDVTFGYDRHQPILKNVSFEIHPGERIGVVGKSGSGKTTIINLLSRFYDVDQGRVLIDGVDIRDMVKDDLRRQIGVVLQEPFLFRGTIYDNLTYGVQETSPQDVIAAAKAANCHDFIMRQPLGYDTYIGERGAGLSGGERQRISIARALLYDPKILILDEATSSVDTESEKHIQDALLRITQGRTTIAIAHRLSTLKNSDRIFVVDRGEIVEQGTHAELLALQGIYYRLVKIQTELSSEPSVDALTVHSK